jgi:hypothetical protein
MKISFSFPGTYGRSGREHADRRSPCTRARRIVVSFTGALVLLTVTGAPAFAVHSPMQTGRADSAPSSATSNAWGAVPTAPTNVRAVGGNASATLTWSAPTTNGRSTITGYIIKPSSGGSQAVGNVTSATISGLTDGNLYTFTVAAVNNAGTGPASTPSNAVTPTAASTSARAALLLPLYDPSSTDWATACSDLSGTNSFVVADIGNPGGPGTVASASWAANIGSCGADVVGVMGYVDTGYCSVPLTTAESQIADWYSWYGADGIKGIFLDRVDNPASPTSTWNCLSGTTSATTYYQALASYVHAESSGQTVAYNFGTNPMSGWALSSTVAGQNANVVVTFENQASAFATWSPANWESSYPAADFSVMLYGDRNANDPAATCALVASQNIGYAFISPASAWTVLPPASFLSAEIADC